MWRQHGRHSTGTTGGNSLHPTQRVMEPEDDANQYLDSRHVLINPTILSPSATCHAAALSVRIRLSKEVQMCFSSNANPAA